MDYTKDQIEEIRKFVNEIMYSIANKSNSNIANKVIQYGNFEFTINEIMNNQQKRQELISVLNEINDRLSAPLFAQSQNQLAIEGPQTLPLSDQSDERSLVPYQNVQQSVNQGGKKGKKRRGGTELINLSEPPGQLAKFYNLGGLHQTPDPLQQAAAVPDFNNIKQSVTAGMTGFGAGAITSGLPTNVERQLNPSLVGGGSKKKNKNKK